MDHSPESISNAPMMRPLRVDPDRLPFGVSEIWWEEVCEREMCRVPGMRPLRLSVDVFGEQYYEPW